jgi:hypothetical protein
MARSAIDREREREEKTKTGSFHMLFEVNVNNSITVSSYSLYFYK